jgi:hypothetical protein
LLGYLSLSMAFNVGYLSDEGRMFSSEFDAILFGGHIYTVNVSPHRS